MIDIGIETVCGESAKPIHTQTIHNELSSIVKQFG